MTDRSATDRAVEDARALLRLMQSGSAKELHVLTTNAEFFLAAAGGRPNPMRNEAPAPEASDTSLSFIRAPHIATVVRVSVVGDEVAAGQTAVVIRLLGEEISIPVTTTTRIASCHVTAGAIVEYDEPLVSVRRS